MADTAKFEIIYAGPALENNEMDIRELAPALIAVADLLEEANVLINGGGSKINVNVHGSFKSGSFGIDFTVIHNVFQNVISMFNSEGFSAASNLLSLLGLKDIGKGLIWLLQKLRKDKIKKIENVDDNRVRITITRSVTDKKTFEETINVDKKVIDLYKSKRIRDALAKVISEPLSRDSIVEFRTSAEGSNETIILGKEEKEFFETPLLGDEILGETITEAFLQVVLLSFKEDNKWKFSRGELVFFASIEDPEFLAKIDHNEINFSKDDILKVKLKAKDILTGKGIRSEYTVVEVLEHRTAARQLLLPMEGDHDDQQ